jgi:hypothetical protein
MSSRLVSENDSGQARVFLAEGARSASIIGALCAPFSNARMSSERLRSAPLFVRASRAHMRAPERAAKQRRSGAI